MEEVNADQKTKVDVGVSNVWDKALRMDLSGINEFILIGFVPFSGRLALRHGVSETLVQKNMQPHRTTRSVHKQRDSLTNETADDSTCDGKFEAI